MTHPLTDNLEWVFWKPSVRMKATFLLLPKGGKETVTSGAAVGTCRETILSNTRGLIHMHVMEELVRRGYRRKFHRTARMRLFDEALLPSMPGGNQLQVMDSGIKKKGEHGSPMPPGRIEEFLE